MSTLDILLAGEKLDLSSPVRYVATRLDKAGCAVIIADLVKEYHHGFGGDLARIVKAGSDNPTDWIIRKAISELGDQLNMEGEFVSLVTGKIPSYKNCPAHEDRTGTLTWRGKIVTAVQEPRLVDQNAPWRQERTVDPKHLRVSEAQGSVFAPGLLAISVQALEADKREQWIEDQSHRKFKRNTAARSIKFIQGAMAAAGDTSWCKTPEDFEACRFIADLLKQKKVT